MADSILGQPGMRDIYVMLDETIDTTDSLIKAVDVCFKLFFVFNAEYPKEAVDPWTFIQKAVYDIDTVYDQKGSHGSSMSLKLCCSYYIFKKTNFCTVLLFGG